jgi:hypothetical protein
VTCAREDFDFSELPEELQDCLATYWAMRAERGSPVYSIQQGAMVAKLLSATESDYAKACTWVGTAIAKGWQDFYDPHKKSPNPKGTTTNEHSGINERAKRKLEAEYERMYGEPMSDFDKNRSTG